MIPFDSMSSLLLPPPELAAVEFYVLEILVDADEELEDAMVEDASVEDVVEDTAGSVLVTEVDEAVFTSATSATGAAVGPIHPALGPPIFEGPPRPGIGGGAPPGPPCPAPPGPF